MDPSFYENLTDEERQEIVNNYLTIQTLLVLRNNYIDSCKSLLQAEGFSLNENYVLFKDLHEYFNAEQELYQSLLEDYTKLIS